MREEDRKEVAPIEGNTMEADIETGGKTEPKEEKVEVAPPETTPESEIIA